MLQQGEDLLRESGIPYVIVRPCALTEEPAGADLIFDQGDNITVLWKQKMDAFLGSSALTKLPISWYISASWFLLAIHGNYIVACILLIFPNANLIQSLTG